MRKSSNKFCGLSSWWFKTTIVTLQIIGLVSSQSTNINPNDQKQLDSHVEISRENRAINTDAVEEECPMCNSIEMPMELAEKINEVSDIDVFIHDFVDTSNSLSNVSSAYAHPGNRKRRAASSQQLRQATCKPIETIVNLVPPEEKDPTIYYFPSCVLVKQCGGCCAHSGTTCTPTDTTEKQITIKKTKFVNDPKLANLGDVSVTIKEHNACKCLCRKTAADCNSLQRFVKSQCRCECLNKKEEGLCAQNPNKLFDSNSCACVCRETRECTTGMRYDQETCSCQPFTESYTEQAEEDDYFLHFGDHIHNETYEATDEIKYETEVATQNNSN